MVKRTTAQRRAAAKAAWARRRATMEKAVLANPTVREFMESNEPPRVAVSPPVTVSVTLEGKDYYLGISNNGSLHRVRVTADALKTMALDALRLV
jgi:hypothetical protein